MSRFRPINEQELAVFRRMLHAGVENREDLLRQLDGAQIDVLDNDDSLVLRTQSIPRACSTVSQKQSSLIATESPFHCVRSSMPIP